jgi:hypothetical protein
MCSLYTASATLSKSTTAYTSSNEVSGTGYTAGGTAMTGFTVSISGDTAYIDWTTDPSWATSTLTGVVTALIYNASRSNKAVGVLTFGSTSTTAGTFTVVLPAPGTTATVTIS